jgi:hypothetical protein
MVDFLVEESGPIYAVLFLIAAVSCFLYWNRRQTRYVAVGAVCVVLVAGLWFLASHYESDGQQIARKIDDMGKGVEARDLDRIFANISNGFRFENLDKKAFRKGAEDIIHRRDVTQISVWEFAAESISREKREANVSFKVKPRGNFGGDAAYYLVRARFVLDPDGEWRMQGFQVFNPFVDTKTPLQIPGL